MTLVIDENFTGGVGNWVAFFDSLTSLTQSSAQSHSSPNSAALVAAGANAYIGMNRSSSFAPTVGVEYSANWWVYLPTTGNYWPIVQNANGSDQILGSLTAITANTWTNVEVPVWEATAWNPGANELTFRLDRSGGGTFSGATVYYDDIQLDDGTAPPVTPPVAWLRA